MVLLLELPQQWTKTEIDELKPIFSWNKLGNPGGIDISIKPIVVFWINKRVT